MNDSIYRINLDIHTVGSQVFLPVKRGDTARTILIRLTEGYKSYQIADGCSARFCGKKPDGNYLYNDCTISGGIITYNLTSQTTACEGVVECEIQLFDANGKQITSPRFSLVVDGTVYNGEEIASTPEADSLKELTDRAKEIVNQYDEGVIVGKEYVDNNFANALKGSAPGKVVAIRDVSPVQHDVKVKATPVVVAETDLSANESIMFDPISNWVITTSAMLEYLKFTFEDKSIQYTPMSPAELGIGAKYFKIVCVNGVCTFFYYDDKEMTSLQHTETTAMSSPLVGVGTDDAIHIKVEVYEALQETKISVYGKNLIPYPYAEYFERRGITFTPNADGTVTVNGQNDGTGTARLTFTHTNWDLPLGKYMMHSGHNVCIASAQILRANGSYNYASNSSFTLNEGDRITGMWVQVVAADSDVVFDNVIVKPQLECGTVATEFESYREPVTYAVSGGEVTVPSQYPSMTFIPNNEDVTLSVEYNRDINKAFQELQQVIAQLQTLAVATVPMNEGV